MPSDGPMIESDLSTVRIGAGAMLRAGREDQGIPIAMLAVSLKVPVKKLEALEADRYDLLPDIVFVRALASSVCRTLKIDGDPILAALPRSDFPKIKTDESGLNTTFNDSVSGAGNTLRSQLTKPLGIAVLLLLAGIVAIAFFPSRLVNDPASEVPPADTPAVIPVPSVVSGMETQPAPVHQMPSSAAALTLSDSMNGTGQVGSASLVQAPALNSSAPVMSSGAAALAGSERILTLQAHGVSWVEVVDAQGVMQLRKTLMKDEIVSVAGAMPLTVVVGRADSVSVVIRGQPFDTAPVSKNNVARFEVK